MRCLYCGKELALLKRLTKGSEFCSEAHRTKYQEEFNDLALNRLLQSRSAGEEAPSPQPLVEELEPEAEPVATVPAEAPKLAPKPATPVTRRAPVIPAAKAKPAPKPQAKEAVVGMTGWIILSPELQEPGPAAIVGGEPPILEEDTDPVLPWRSVKVQQVAREYGLQWANPVSWTPPVEGSKKPVRPLERNVEVREFSRQAPSPVLQQERSRHDSQQIAPSSAVGEAMDITNQPRQPAVAPVLWQAGPQPASALEPVLGEFARLDFPVSGFDEASSTNPQPAQYIPVSAPAPLPQPAAAAPPPVPVPAIVEEAPPPAPSAAAPAPPATQPLPLTLQGLSAQAARTVVGSVLPAAAQPQAPAPTALPLRPAMVLVPVPVAQPAPQPPPLEPKTMPAAPAPAAQPKPPVNAPQLRQSTTPAAPVIKQVAPTVTQAQQQAKPAPVPQKAPAEAPKPQAVQNNKGKRPEVRIIPTAPTQTSAPPQAAKPAAQPVQPVAAQQPGPKPVAQPAAKAPVPIAAERNTRPVVAETKAEPRTEAQAKPATQPAAKPDVKAAQAKAEVKPEPKPAPKPEPKAEPRSEAKHVGPRSTLISADVADTPTPISSSKPVDLGLPELHAMEEGGFWAKLPGGVKIAVAAVLVLAILGFAFVTLNSPSATAKVANTEPVYELGRPMNTNGWIENWTPNDNNRRVTLLRGSQESVDYRMQFNAQIQSKAVGWMFRGLNPRNFYVAKIEKSKPGAEFGSTFVRYAVIDGRNEGRIEKPINLKVHVGTIYQIKFEAIGAHFKVWVQGNLVDEWNDKRLGSGGLGLYSEKDEVGIIQGDVNAYELVAAKDGK